MSTFDTARKRSTPPLDFCPSPTPEKRMRLIAMTSMAWTLAHEISQPLTSATNYIRACARQLQRRGQGCEDLLGMLENARKETARASEIIGRMRRFILDGKVAARRESLERMIGNATSLLPLPSRAGLEIVTTVSPDANHVIVDRLQIEQALAIILVNASEAVAGRSVRRISIESLRVGDQAVVLIQDSGPGLTNYAATQAFRPLFTTKEGGMGLGLPICRTIVEAHGGRVWVESSTSGGATFGMSLPVAS